MDAQTPNMQQNMMGGPVGMQMQMMQQPMGNHPDFGNDQFSAKPRVVPQKKYRDPYREYV